MADAARPDPVEHGFFRKGPDGRLVFFPWGLSGRGYRVPDAAGERKATRAVRLLIGAILAVGGWGGHALVRAFEDGDVSPAAAARALAAPGAALAAVLVAYAVGVARLVERFPDSDLRVDREARLREAAAVAQPGRVALAGAATAAVSALVVVVEPRAGWLATLGVATGVGMVVWGWRLLRVAREASVQTAPGEPVAPTRRAGGP
ncbi:MAG: hypothetical protein R3263_02620 [Myxococcota bacterium]|nr:hypothetical protein [Myxococcota bacterium]